MKRTFSVLAIIAALFILKTKLLPSGGSHSERELPRNEAGRAEAPQAKSLKTPEHYAPLIAVKAMPEQREKAVPPAKPVKRPAPAARKKQAGSRNSIPNCFARYEMSMDDYLAFMRSKGAKVIVYDVGKEKPVCDDHLGDITNFTGFSRYSRRITDDFPGKDLLKRVEDKYGPGNYEILLVLPEALAEAFNNSIAGVLRSRGINESSVDSIHLAYRGSRTGITVYIEKVVGDFGSIRINKAFSL